MTVTTEFAPLAYREGIERFLESSSGLFDRALTGEYEPGLLWMDHARQNRIKAKPRGALRSCRKILDSLHALGRDSEARAVLERSAPVHAYVEETTDFLNGTDTELLMPMAVMAGCRHPLSVYRDLDRGYMVWDGDDQVEVGEQPWHQLVAVIAALAADDLAEVEAVMQRWSVLMPVVPSERRGLMRQHDLVAAIVAGDQAGVEALAVEASGLLLECLAEDRDPEADMFTDWDVTALLVIAQRRGMSVPTNLAGLPVGMAAAEWRD